MKISARNVLKGKIVDIKKGATTAHVRIDIGGGVVVTSSITNESVDELKLSAGQNAYAVVKAVFENFAEFRHLHPALFALKLSDMLPDSTLVPLHPGAAKYYREAGLSP